jgi:hypothetical protein
MKNIGIVSTYCHGAQGAKVSEVTVTVACVFADGNAVKFVNVNDPLWNRSRSEKRKRKIIIIEFHVSG